MSGIPANQIFCLRWNNHQSTIVSILEQQLRSETLVDVTLAVDDGHILRAHKMVLCACSPYFAELLSRSPDKHPIVILRDVTFRDMQAILDFMYRSVAFRTQWTGPRGHTGLMPSVFLLFAGARCPCHRLHWTGCSKWQNP